MVRHKRETRRAIRRSSRIETVAVERRDLVVRVMATGTVQPVTEGRVSSELSGMVRTVEADYNDLVTVRALGVQFVLDINVVLVAFAFAAALRHE